jgi:hypothetical protein
MSIPQNIIGLNRLGHYSPPFAANVLAELQLYTLLLAAGQLIFALKALLRICTWQWPQEARPQWIWLSSTKRSWFEIRCSDIATDGDELGRVLDGFCAVN